jgi:hypothetical protein
VDGADIPISAIDFLVWASEVTVDIWKCLSVDCEHRDFYQQHQTSPFLSHTAFAFLYGLFNRELVVHSVYRIATVSSRCCRVRSSYRRIYNHPPFWIFTRQTGFLCFTHPTCYHVATGLVGCACRDSLLCKTWKTLRSGLYLASCSASEHSAITMRGVASCCRRRVRSSYPIPTSSLYLIFPLPSGD